MAAPEVTVTRMDILAPSEAEWDKFLASLPAWELHALYKYEMILHDEYIEGVTTLAEIGLTISFGHAS